MNTFYSHPDPAIRKAQRTARDRARQYVKDGRIAWGQPEPTLPTGFMWTGRVPIAITTLIALHELRKAGEVIVDERAGTVHLTAKAGTS